MRSTEPAHRSSSQAYEFTSLPIEQAIGRAFVRGVDVRVILDKSNERKKNSAAGGLALRGLHMLTDDRVSIAHNKVMVIDGKTVITGSFNFTVAAQKRNAENVLVIHDDATVAGEYAANWQRRAAESRPFGLR
jgi:phosphatidylserine/phosphatidylglycerophosphate/cardiolipin synthase-like enzyme